MNKMKISVSTALRLAKFFGNPVEFWLETQLNYELAQTAADAKLSADLKGIEKVKKPAPGAKNEAKKPAQKAPAGAASAKAPARGKGKKPAAKAAAPVKRTRKK